MDFKVNAHFIPLMIIHSLAFCFTLNWSSTQICYFNGVNWKDLTLC